MKPRNAYSVPAKFRKNAGAHVHKRPTRAEEERRAMRDDYNEINDTFDEYEEEIANWYERTQEDPNADAQ